MKTEAENQLAKLVAMPTLSDDIAANDQALDYIEDYLKQRGMHCRRDRFDGHGTLLAATRKPNLLTPKVLLAGHVDVMDGSAELFKLRQQDGKLYGRGVYDMKFSLAGYLQIVDDLKGKLQNYDFGILVTTDEEYGGRDDINGTHRLVEKGLRPSICILPDSTAPGWDIETVAKGFWRFDMIAKGRTAHGSRPWDGESASVKLVQALHELGKLFKDQNIATDSYNLGKIHGGVTYNQVPDHMEAAVEIRYLSAKSLKSIQKTVQQICKQHDVSTKDRIVGPAVPTDIDHPLVKQYLHSVKAVTGRTPQPFTSCAASDAPYFFEVGINCIISCCRGGGHHSEHEWIDRSSFLQFVPILHDHLSKTAKG